MKFASHNTQSTCICKNVFMIHINKTFQVNKVLKHSLIRIRPVYKLAKYSVMHVVLNTLIVCCFSNSRSGIVSGLDIDIHYFITEKTGETSVLLRQ